MMSTTQLTFLAAGLALVSALFANHVNNTCYSPAFEQQQICPLPFLLPKPIPSGIEIERLRQEKAHFEAERKEMQAQMDILQKTISELKQSENEKTLLRRQVETMQQQLAQSQQTEMERVALRQQISQLQQKLSEISVAIPPTLAPKPLPPKISVSLPLTKDGKVDFPALFSPQPPSPPPEPKLVEQDTFETKEEFAARKVEFERGIAARTREFSERMQEFEEYRVQLIEVFNQSVAQHDPKVQAGTAYLEKQNYNVNDGIFVINLIWADWMRESFALDATAKITAVRDHAKALFEEGQQKPVFVTLQLKGTQKVVSSNFMVGLDREVPLSMATPQVFAARDKLKDGSLGPEMVWIPAGTFQMGSNEHDSEKPVHAVSLKGFALGRYEVTFEEYDKFCEATGREKPKDEGWGRGKRPIINVSWDDTKEYIQWLSEQTGKEYRLPSEAQWEYACRAGSTGKYSFGDDINQLGNYGWYSSNSGGKTHSVGEKQPNKFGLYDMHGNVWEWLEDVWHENYNGASIDGNVWVIGGELNKRIIRGGSWYYKDSYFRCANRYWSDTRSEYFNGGFRLSRM